MPLLTALFSLAQTPTLDRAPPAEASETETPHTDWATLAETLGAAPSEATPEVTLPPVGQHVYELSGLPGKAPMAFRVTAVSEGKNVTFVTKSEGLGWSKQPAVTGRFDGRWWLTGPDPELIHAAAVLLGAAEGGPLFAVDLSELSVTHEARQEGWSWGEGGLLRLQQSWALDDQGFMNRCSCPMTSTSGTISWDRVVNEDGWPVFAQERRTLTYTQHAGGAVHLSSVWEDAGVLTWQLRG